MYKIYSLDHDGHNFVNSTDSFREALTKAISLAQLAALSGNHRYGREYVIFANDKRAVTVHRDFFEVEQPSSVREASLNLVGP